ncbi:MAG: cobyrinate a,c-diamide synthase [Treponemataceae bacterium]
MKKMKAVMISALSSNAGKTTVSALLLNALKKKGLDFCGIKTGPDQIDREILSQASGKPAGNVDKFLMTQEGMKVSLGLMESEYAIIEGVMGCFDGIGTSSKNSSFEIAQDLNVDIVLVHSPEGEMFSIIPKLKGFLDFSENRIKAIILNKTNPELYKTYKKMIEENLPIKVLGFLPKTQNLSINEDYLGLDTKKNCTQDEAFKSICKNIDMYIDVEKFISLFKTVLTKNLANLKRTKTKVAIAKDECVNLYYSENISILEKYAQVKYFSPLHDKYVPDCDFLYLGGTQIKSFANELSQNKSMRDSIKEIAEAGIYILAEGESLCYLCESFDNIPMCGIFSNKAKSTERLHNFGYKILKLQTDTILGKKGTILYAAEYHKSKVSPSEINLFDVTKASTKKNYSDGYIYKNTIAFFQNINFASCVKTIYSSLLSIQQTLQK